jgi:hypothetical protein
MGHNSNSNNRKSSGRNSSSSSSSNSGAQHYCYCRVQRSLSIVMNEGVATGAALLVVGGSISKQPTNYTNSGRN